MGRSRAGLCVIAMVCCGAVSLVSEAFAAPSLGRAGGGGGARPGFGGGGARPNVSMPSVSRPSFGGGGRPNISTPNLSRPNVSIPNMSRPNVAIPQTRPGNIGASRPSLGTPGGNVGRPNVTRPNVNVPTNKLPPPVSKPSIPSLPSLGNSRPTTLPGNISKPSTLPGNISKPTTLPGNIGGGLKPPIGITKPKPLPGTPAPSKPDRPTIGRPERPVTLPGQIEKPGIGNLPNRPGRPEWPTRPSINLPDNPNWPNRGDRPTTLPEIVRPDFGNRPGWDRPHWNRPDWGWGNGRHDWHDHWHNNCVHHHYHGWYHGCWSGYWGSGWYSPLAWGAVGWGLGTLTNDWGYYTSFYNPYYVPIATAVPVYNYSQPVVVNNYLPADSTIASSESQVAGPTAQAALSTVDQGLAAFKSGDYRTALSLFDSAVKSSPGDAVVHEVRALTLFALGEYAQAAATLNSLLAAAPGMDWTTVGSLYGNVQDYTTQLRKLEQHCRVNAGDAGAFFVLAYHYLVIGDKTNAVSILRSVIAKQPKDVTAKRMLDALAPPEAAAPKTAVGSTNAADSPAAVSPAADLPGVEIDLVGNWEAQSGNTAIQLKVGDASEFTWTAKENGKVTAEINGNLVTTGEAVSLNSSSQGSIAGTVKPIAADRWQFNLAGAPTSDSGLLFVRK